MGQSAAKECCVDERQDGPVLDPAAGPAAEQISGRVALGGGCFWGVEHYMTKNFQNRFPKSIQKCRVGFMSPNPSAKRQQITYQEVCRGKSGYVEVLIVELQDPQAHFEDFIRFFFGIHDPTTMNRQGADRGSQYQSIIFCADECQTQIVNKVKEELRQLLDCGAIQCFEHKTVQTQIVGMTNFIEAAEKHQNYLSKHPNGYCNHFVRSRDRRPPRTPRQFKFNLPTAFITTLLPKSS